MTTYQPITLVKGRDKTISGTVTDENGTAIDISAGAITLMVKNQLSDTDASAVLTATGSSLGVDGTFTITVADTDTSSLDLRSRWYEILYVASDGSEGSAAIGKWRMTGNVDN